MKHDPNFMDSFNRDHETRKAARRLLEVHEGASDEELKRAFRRAAVVCHPDHVGNTEDANKRFALVKCAYELLANDQPCERLLEEVESWVEAPEELRCLLMPYGRVDMVVSGFVPAHRSLWPYAGLYDHVGRLLKRRNGAFIVATVRL